MTIIFFKILGNIQLRPSFANFHYYIAIFLRQKVLFVELFNKILTFQFLQIIS